MDTACVGQLTHVHECGSVCVRVFECLNLLYPVSGSEGAYFVVGDAMNETLANVMNCPTIIDRLFNGFNGYNGEVDTIHITTSHVSMNVGKYSIYDSEWVRLRQHVNLDHTSTALDGTFRMSKSRHRLNRLPIASTAIASSNNVEPFHIWNNSNKLPKPQNISICPHEICPMYWINATIRSRFHSQGERNSDTHAHSCDLYATYYAKPAAAAPASTGKTGCHRTLYIQQYIRADARPRIRRAFPLPFA